MSAGRSGEAVEPGVASARARAAATDEAGSGSSMHDGAPGVAFSNELSNGWISSQPARRRC